MTGPPPRSAAVPELQLETFATAVDFLAAAEPYLLEAEIENNLILGIARGLRQTLAVDRESAPYFALVREAGVRVCGFSTLPGKAGITRCASTPALALLARGLVAARPLVHDLVGPEPTIGTFVGLYTALRGARIVRTVAQRIHQLRTVQPPARVPRGRFRPASAGDVEIVARWLGEFMAELADPLGDPRELAATRIAAGQFVLWEGGAPVSMAGWTGRTEHGARIGFVYTPPALRGRGYASACVRALSEALLASGLQYCCLYTDLANPISNAIYARIGYRPVCDAAMYSLSLEPTTPG